MKQIFAIALLLLTSFNVAARTASVERQKLNFNAEWRLQIGDFPEAAKMDFDDSQWRQVTLPYAFNGDEAFRKAASFSSDMPRPISEISRQQVLSCRIPFI